MDRKILTRAVVFGLVLHIVIVAFYINTRNPHATNFAHDYSQEMLGNHVTSRDIMFRSQQEDGKISGLPDQIERDMTMVSDLDIPATHTDGAIAAESIEKDGLEESNQRLPPSLSTGSDKNSIFHGNGKASLEEKELLRKYTLEEKLNDHRGKNPSPSTTPSPSVSSSSKEDPDIPVVPVPWKTLRDETHPLFDRAFSRNTKPTYLLAWKPSLDSDKHFRKVEGADAYLYSAYLEKCTPAYVRLIGISNRNRLSLGAVFCHYFDSHHEWLETQQGRMLALKDNHFLNHTASSVDCPLTPELNPSFVSVTKTDHYVQTTNNRPIPIQTHPEKTSRNFTMCFSPLHSFYNYTFQLVQSIELNRLFGASHFVFYNFSTTPQTDEILRYYQKQGIATVLPWPLPHLQSWYYGQIAAINDCIYRNKMTSRYVVIVDTDEFIVPNNHSNWSNLLNDVTQFSHLRDTLNTKSDDNGYKKCTVLENDDRNRNKNYNQNTQPLFGSFMFRCSFFANKPLTAAEERVIKAKRLKPTRQQSDLFNFYRSEPMVYLKRNDEIYEHVSRSKLIVRPDTIISHAIHKSVEHVSGYGTAYVNQSAAFLHHYRPYKIKSLNTLDVSVLKFKDELFERLKNVVKKFPLIFDDYQNSEEGNGK